MLNSWEKGVQFFHKINFFQGERENKQTEEQGICVWPFIQCPDEELCAMPCDHQPECTAEDEYDESVDIGCSNEDINSAHELFATDVEQGAVSFLHFYLITNLQKSTKFHHLNLKSYNNSLLSPHSSLKMRVLDGENLFFSAIHRNSYIIFSAKTRPG